ncbi:MAG: hypothetical protein ACJ788_11155, partial [Ktedonobacteraceae bacterium]
KTRKIARAGRAFAARIAEIAICFGQEESRIGSSKMLIYPVKRKEARKEKRVVCLETRTRATGLGSVL